MSAPDAYKADTSWLMEGHEANASELEEFKADASVPEGYEADVSAPEGY